MVLNQRITTDKCWKSNDPSLSHHHRHHTLYNLAWSVSSNWMNLKYQGPALQLAVNNTVVTQALNVYQNFHQCHLCHSAYSSGFPGNMWTC